MAQMVCIQRGHNTQPFRVFIPADCFDVAQALWPELFFAASMLAFHCCCKCNGFLRIVQVLFTPGLTLTTLKHHR